MNCDGLYRWMARHPDQPLYSELMGQVDLACEPATVTGLANITSGMINSVALPATPDDIAQALLDAQIRTYPRLPTTYMDSTAIANNVTGAAWTTAEVKRPLEGPPIPTGTLAYTVHGSPPPRDVWMLYGSLGIGAIGVAMVLTGLYRLLRS